MTEIKSIPQAKSIGMGDIIVNDNNQRFKVRKTAPALSWPCLKAILFI